MHLDTRTIVIVATLMAVVPTLISVSVWYTKPTCRASDAGPWERSRNPCHGVPEPPWRGAGLDRHGPVEYLGGERAILYFQGVRQFCALRLYGWPEYLAGTLTVSAVIYFRYLTTTSIFGLSRSAF